MAFGDGRLNRPHHMNSDLVCYCPVQTTITPPHDLKDMKSIGFAQKLIIMASGH